MFVENPNSEDRVFNNQYGLFFLIKTGVSTYKVTDHYFPAIVASPVARLAPIAEPLEKVAYELTQVLDMPEKILTDPASNIERSRGMVFTLSDGKSMDGPHAQAQEIYKEASDALNSIPYRVTGKYLQTLASSSSLSARLWADGCIIEGKNLRHLDSLSLLVVNPPSNEEFAIAALAGAILDNAKSPEFVPVLTTLMHASSAKVRRSAAFNLREINTSEIIKPLATLGLNDSDADVRYLAISGLEQVTGAPMDSMVIMKNEKPYLQKWRKWAAEHVH